MLFLHGKLLDYFEKVEKESGVFNDLFEKRAGSKRVLGFNVFCYPH